MHYVVDIISNAHVKAVMKIPDGTIALTGCKHVRPQIWRILCMIKIAYITRSQ